MARRSNIHVGLEIGTSKTCIVVGEARPDTGVRILGMGVSKSVGVRRGEIHDFSQVRTCLKDALAQAEDNSDVEIGSVYLSVTGSHISGVNHLGPFRLPDGESVVTAEHVKAAREVAREVAIPKDHNYLHHIIRHYALDELEMNVSPVGLTGRTVDADFHIVHGIGARLQNSIRLVREVPLEVDDVVFAPIATAQMALDREQRDRGALLIDIGAGTSDFALYLNGAIAASGCIAVGGEHVTNDLHLVTGLPWSKAEKLKITEGDASADPSRSVGSAKLVDERGFAEVEVQRNILNEVIRQRFEDTLRLIVRKLPPDALKNLGAGVFFTGGSSKMRGLSELASQVFGRDIYLSEQTSALGAEASVRDPGYATAIGLIRYAQIMETEKAPPAGCIHRVMRMFWPFGS